MNVWGCDWSLKTGVALAWRRDRTIHTMRLDASGEKGAERLAGLYLAASSAATIAALSGLPTAVYVEQAVGQPNPRLLEAQGVVQAALWSTLVGRTPHPPNVWLLRATEWRQALEIPRAAGENAKSRRAARKLQQQTYAIGLGAERGISEDEFDAVCLMRAGELDIGETTEGIAA